SLLRKISLFATAPSPACQWECWWSKLPNTVAHALRLAVPWNKGAFAVPGNVTSKNSWGPNIKQGAKLVATWEDVWEELPADVHLALAPVGDESLSRGTASLFGEDSEFGLHEKKILAVPKADEGTHIDEIVKRLEPEVSSSELFGALFERELSRKVKQLPGKNFVKSF